MPGPSDIAVLAGVVLLAFTVEAATGFGSMVVALALGALWFEVPALLGWLVPVNLVLSAYLVVRGRAALDARFLTRRALPLMTAGLVAGSLLSRAVEVDWLAPAFGVFVVAVAAWQVREALGPQEALLPLPAAARVSALLGAGVIHGLFATGGPLAVFVSARELRDKAAFRATLSALWVVLNLLLLPRLVADGVLGRATLPVSAALLVPLGVGLVAGELLHRRLDERRFRVVVGGTLAVAGAVLLANALRGDGR